MPQRRTSGIPGFCTLRCTLTLKSLRFLVFLGNVSRYFPKFLAFRTILTRWKSQVRIPAAHYKFSKGKELG